MDELSLTGTSISITRHPGCSSEEVVDYVKPVGRKKLDTLLINLGTNDLVKSDKTMRKVRKWAGVIKELHYTENIQIVFSSIILRTDKDFGNKIKLRSYCLGKGFVFVDNDSIN